jgi:hypothetical protein
MKVVQLKLKSLKFRIKLFEYSKILHNSRIFLKLFNIFRYLRQINFYEVLKNIFISND